ncbi:hypothetical protein [Ralstonia syzygii]|uniref:Uncharacterized protein n=1 Tax=Ralstonia syzygii R24 TaxID=907261 RepID=G3A4J5_9RALS|nr:hypothetical protein [Ralstonia syzygii]CCA88842.1 hypothetical protein RALSY_30599 [Ralstonia syzygii R24]
MVISLCSFLGHDTLAHRALAGRLSRAGQDCKSACTHTLAQNRTIVQLFAAPHFSGKCFIRKPHLNKNTATHAAALRHASRKTLPVKALRDVRRIGKIRAARHRRRRSSITDQ